MEKKWSRYMSEAISINNKNPTIAEILRKRFLHKKLQELAKLLNYQYHNLLYNHKPY